MSGPGFEAHYLEVSPGCGLGEEFDPASILSCVVVSGSVRVTGPAGEAEAAEGRAPQIPADRVPGLENAGEKPVGLIVVSKPSFLAALGGSLAEETYAPGCDL